MLRAKPLCQPPPKRKSRGSSSRSLFHLLSNSLLTSNDLTCVEGYPLHRLGSTLTRKTARGAEFGIGPSHILHAKVYRKSQTEVPREALCSLYGCCDCFQQHQCFSGFATRAERQVSKDQGGGTKAWD